LGTRVVFYGNSFANETQGGFKVVINSPHEEKCEILKKSADVHKNIMKSGDTSLQWTTHGSICANEAWKISNGRFEDRKWHIYEDTRQNGKWYILPYLIFKVVLMTLI
jgi:hypothetical protein